MNSRRAKLHVSRHVACGDARSGENRVGIVGLVVGAPKQEVVLTLVPRARTLV
jgi:hypothetical protein